MNEKDSNEVKNEIVIIFGLTCAIALLMLLIKLIFCTLEFAMNATSALMLMIFALGWFMMFIITPGLTEDSED